MNIALCSARCKLAHFIVLNRKNKTRPRLEKQINMDVSPPPFSSSSSRYVLWALWVGSFWKRLRQGLLATPSVWRCGGWGTSRRPALAAGLRWLRPLLSRPPSRPFFRCVAKWGRLLFEVAGGGGRFLSPQHQCLFLVPLSLTPVSVSAPRS